MRMILSALVLTLSLPTFAAAQVYCTPMGQTVICQGDRGISSATEFGRRGSGQGIIVDESGYVTPYTITPAPRERSTALNPIQPLQRLDEPSHSSRYRGEFVDPLMQPYGSSSYDYTYGY